MLVKDSKGKKVEIISVYGKYEDDIRIEEASYVSSGKEVPDSEIDYIQDKYAAQIYDMWFENRVGAAEFAVDSFYNR